MDIGMMEQHYVFISTPYWEAIWFRIALQPKYLLLVRLHFGFGEMEKYKERSEHLDGFGERTRRRKKKNYKLLIMKYLVKSSDFGYMKCCFSETKTSRNALT
jgi:hypothetical protein